MEAISRKDLDRICDILRGTTDATPEVKEELANTLEKLDVIPKLYAYTYFKRVFELLSDLRGENGSFDKQELEIMVDENDKLGLGFMNDSRIIFSAKQIYNLLKTGFKRENMFCDFDDCKKVQKVIGECMNDAHGDYSEKENKDLELHALYDVDESSQKYIDEPIEYWCTDCIEGSDFDSCNVSCDME